MNSQVGARAEAGRREVGVASWVRRMFTLLVAISTVALLFWIATAYLDADLRQTILSSGFGLC